MTNHTGHATELAREAAATGSPLIVSDSGDGGYNEVVNGAMASGNANHHARFMHDEPLVELKKNWRYDQY